MTDYEPELMYALDSEDEYSDWKNVYNVSGDDVLYCPICSGRVKLWNGQDPNRTYKKQRCFHHIDSICSQESRIHFAYKTWLIEKGSRFKVGDTIYEVASAEIEKTFHTSFGDYRPDISVSTVCGKDFFIEISYTSKKTDEYILKWDGLGRDVLELDVNEELAKIVTGDIPEFKLIYSSSTGECNIKRYVRQDYDDMISNRKIYWSRYDIVNCKIQWERLDQFWLKLRNYYTWNATLNDLVDAFRQLEPDDQRFICNRMRGKHTSLKYELERSYTNFEDYKKARLNYISTVIRNLNQEFGYNSHSKWSKTRLRRQSDMIVFYNSDTTEEYHSLPVRYEMSKQSIYDFFHPIMKKHYEEYILPRKKRFADEELYVESELKPQLNEIRKEIKACKNRLWDMDFSIDDHGRTMRCHVNMVLANKFKAGIYIDVQDVKMSRLNIKEIITQKMDGLLEMAMRGSLNGYTISKIRVVEAC